MTVTTGPDRTCPTAFRYWETKDNPTWTKRRRVFKRLTGDSPGGYRKKVQMKDGNRR